jgi:hypothetical protein
MSNLTPSPAPRAAVILGGWLLATFAWGPILAPALLIAAIVAGALGAPTIAYVCFGAIVAGVGWGFAGSGIWLGLLAFAVLKTEWRDKRFISACLRFTMWLLAGAFLVYSGGGAIWGFLSRWPVGYWPNGKVPPP